jgi:hypothetical protein
MKKSILILALSAIVSLAVSSCVKHTPLAPSTEPVITAVTPAPDSVLITYEIHVVSVDTTKVTNLVNGMGYSYKDSLGVWHTNYKFQAEVAFVPVHAGQYFRGQFYVPTHLTGICFRSALFLLSTTTGDIASNPNNVITMKVHKSGNVIVDRSANGIDSVDWNYGRWNINANVGL